MKSSKRVDLFNEKGEPVGLFEVVDWWLYHYEGMEHLTLGGTTSPETWYTVTTILRRCIEKIRKGKR